MEIASPPNPERGTARHFFSSENPPNPSNFIGNTFTSGKSIGTTRDNACGETSPWKPPRFRNEEIEGKVDLSTKGINVYGIFGYIWFIYIFW